MTTARADLLVVEDDDLALRTLTAILQRSHLSVRSAHDGLEGLAAVRRQVPDLVLLDLMLPELNGFQFLRRLRADPVARVPVIVVTARTDPVNAYWAHRLGADDLVHKPFTIDRLMAAIDRQLASEPDPIAAASPAGSEIRLGGGAEGGGFS